MSDLYFNERGGFRAEFLHVKYPDFAGGGVEGHASQVVAGQCVSLGQQPKGNHPANVAGELRPSQNQARPASNSTFAVPVHSVKHGCVVHGIHTQTGSPDCGGHGNKCQGRWDK